MVRPRGEVNVCDTMGHPRLQVLHLDVMNIKVLQGVGLEEAYLKPMDQRNSGTQSSPNESYWVKVGLGHTSSILQPYPTEPPTSVAYKMILWPMLAKMMGFLNKIYLQATIY